MALGLEGGGAVFVPSGGGDSGIEIENIRHGWSGYEQQAYPSLEARNSIMYILEKLKALQISAMSRHQL